MSLPFWSSRQLLSNIFSLTAYLASASKTILARCCSRTTQSSKTSFRLVVDSTWFFALKHFWSLWSYPHFKSCRTTIRCDQLHPNRFVGKALFQVFLMPSEYVGSNPCNCLAWTWFALWRPSFYPRSARTRFSKEASQYPRNRDVDTRYDSEYISDGPCYYSGKTPLWEIHSSVHHLYRRR